MGHTTPHGLDLLDRAFDRVWQAIAANYDVETAPSVRTSLALVLLQLAGSGARSIDEIEATAKDIASEWSGPSSSLDRGCLNFSDYHELS